MYNFKLSDALTLTKLITEKTIVVTQAHLDELSDNDLILESVSLDEIIDTHFEGLAIHQPLMLEAITSKRNRIEQTMKAFNRKFKVALSSTGIDSEATEIGDPRKAAGFAVLAARIPTSDGQSVSIIFHAPDDDPSKILPNDTLVAFRFLLNKRDITHVVAPSGGHDISLNQVVMALSNLVERNSNKFQKAQASKNKKADEIKTFQDGIEAFEAQKEQLTKDLEKVTSQINSSSQRGESIRSLMDKQVAKNQALTEQLNSAKKAKETEQLQQSTNGNYVSDKIASLVNKMTMMEFDVWATANLKISSSDAAALYQQAKQQNADNAQSIAVEKRDEVRDNARTMVLSEFTQWAKDKLQMKAYDAEVLYNNTIDELKTEFAQKMEKQTVFKIAKQVEAAIVQALGDKVQKVNASSNEIDRAEVKTTFGKSEIYISVNNRDDQPYIYLSGDIHKSNYDTTINYPLGSTELTSDVLNQITTNVANIVEQLTPKMVDVNNLPELGSNSNEVAGKYGKSLTAVIRTAINKAVKERFHYPDKSFKISVRMGSSGSNVYVGVNDAPKELQVYSNEYLAIDSSDHERQRLMRARQYTVEYDAVRAVIDSAVEQFVERGEYDPYADYGTSVNFYYNIDYRFAYNRLSEEQESFNNSLVDEKEVAKEEAKDEASNGEGDNYDSEMSYKEVAKAVRKAIADKAKDSATPFFGGKYAVTSGLSTNKPFVAVTIKQAAQVDLFETKSAIEALLRSYNKVTGSSIDDDVSMKFIPKVESDVKVEKLFWYGLKARPLMVGAAPDIAVEQSMTATEAKKKFASAHENSVRHGAVAYVKALSDDDINKYELVDLNEQPDDEILQKDIVKKARELGAKIERIGNKYMALVDGERLTAVASDIDDVENWLDGIAYWVETEEKLFSGTSPSTVDGDEIEESDNDENALIRDFITGTLHKAQNQLGGIDLIEKGDGYDVRINDAIHHISISDPASITAVKQLLEGMLEQANKPVSKEWDTFKLPALPNLAKGVIPEHFKMVYNRSDNSIKVTSSKYKKLDLTIEYVDAGKAEMYMYELPQNLGLFSNPKQLNYSLNYGVSLTVKHLYNGVSPALEEENNEVEETALEPEVIPKDYGSLTPYQNDEGEWLVDDDGSVKSFPLLEDAENYARFAEKVNEQQAEAKAKNAELKAKIDAFNEEFSHENVSLYDTDESQKQFEQRVARLSKETEFRGATSTVKGHVDALLADTFKVVKESVIDTKALEKAKKEMATLEAEGNLNNPIKSDRFVYDRLANEVADPVANFSKDEYSLISLDGQETVNEKSLGKTAMEYVESLVKRNKAQVTGVAQEPTPPATEEPEQQEPTNQTSIDKLKAGLSEENDPDKLIELLEAAMTEVEATDQMDEYEPLLEQASDRVTELLEQQ